MSESKTIRMNPTWETALGLQTISSDRRGPVLSLADDVDDDVATVPTVAATAMAAMVPTTVAVVAAAAPTAPAAARDVANNYSRYWYNVRLCEFQKEKTKRQKEKTKRQRLVWHVDTYLPVPLPRFLRSRPHSSPCYNSNDVNREREMSLYIVLSWRSYVGPTNCTLHIERTYLCKAGLAAACSAPPGYTPPPPAVVVVAPIVDDCENPACDMLADGSMAGDNPPS